MNCNAFGAGSPLRRSYGEFKERGGGGGGSGVLDMYHQQQYGDVMRLSVDR